MHYYLLLYKIKQSPLLWIVIKDQHYKDLLLRIDKLWELEEYTSNVDEYWIVKQNNCQKEDIDEGNMLKQFTIFKPDRDSELVFKSK